LRRIEKPIFDLPAVQQRRQKLLVEGQRIYLQERADVVAGLAQLRLPLNDERHEPVEHPAAEYPEPTGSRLFQSRANGLAPTAFCGKMTVCD
jgi:hypothetical protein